MELYGGCDRKGHAVEVYARENEVEVGKETINYRIAIVLYSS